MPVAYFLGVFLLDLGGGDQLRQIRLGDHRRVFLHGVAFPDVHRHDVAGKFGADFRPLDLLFQIDQVLALQFEVDFGLLQFLGGHFVGPPQRVDHLQLVAAKVQLPRAQIALQVGHVQLGEQRAFLHEISRLHVHALDPLAAVREKVLLRHQRANLSDAADPRFQRLRADGVHRFFRQFRRRDGRKHFLLRLVGQQPAARKNDGRRKHEACRGQRESRQPAGPATN